MFHAAEPVSGDQLEAGLDLAVKAGFNGRVSLDADVGLTKGTIASIYQNNSLLLYALDLYYGRIIALHVQFVAQLWYQSHSAKGLKQV